jgi:predicted RNA-binding protein with PUA-like domain
MAHWLLKSEPFKYAWSKLVADGRTHWDGVRNHQAAANLKAMKVGEHAFFYHSNEGLDIVGVAEIVDIKPVRPVVTPVTLKEIKADPRLAEFALVRQSRLSVVPVRETEWALLCKKAGIPA